MALHQIPQNFLIHEENCIFFFISVEHLGDFETNLTREPFTMFYQLELFFLLNFHF
jgi:hypothetical protein